MFAYFTSRGKFLEFTLLMLFSKLAIFKLENQDLENSLNSSEIDNETYFRKHLAWSETTAFVCKFHQRPES